MRLVTAPESLEVGLDLISVFLAGGITDCPEWQREVIAKLDDLDCVVFNPRRDNFPIDDPGAADEQIAWEFNALSRCNIFSMWFCNSKSDQPICFYELGRNLALHSADTIIVGCDSGFRRKQDVIIQTKLAIPEIKVRLDFDEYVGVLRDIIIHNQRINSRFKRLGGKAVV